MRQVFASHDHTKVLHFQSILDGHGMLTLVKNNASASIDGVLPGDIILPELWVMEDSDYDRAIEILKPFYEGTAGDADGGESSEGSSSQ